MRWGDIAENVKSRDQQSRQSMVSERSGRIMLQAAVGARSLGEAGRAAA